MAVTFETAAELVQKLGNIPLERICFTPPPGTATMRDLRPPCAAPTDSTNSSMVRWWRKPWDGVNRFWPVV